MAHYVAGDLGKMKLNEAERQNSERLNSWQQVKTARLYSDLLQALKERSLDSTGFAADRTLLAASAIAQRGLIDTIQRKPD